MTGWLFDRNVTKTGGCCYRSHVAAFNPIIAHNLRLTRSGNEAEEVDHRRYELISSINIRDFYVFYGDFSRPRYYGRADFLVYSFFFIGSDYSPNRRFHLPYLSCTQRPYLHLNNAFGNIETRPELRT